MLHLGSLVCPNCSQNEHEFYLFDNEKRRPVVGTCGHSMCEVCVNKNPEISCFVCLKRKAFIPKTINYDAARVREEYNRNIFQGIQSFWDFSVKGIGQCATCSDVSKVKTCQTCIMEVFKTLNAHEYATCTKCAETEYVYYGYPIARLCDYVSLQNNQNLACHVCSKLLNDPWFSPMAADHRILGNTPQKFQFCSNCLLDNHDGHIAHPQDYTGKGNAKSFEKLTVPIMRVLLEKQLKVPEDQIMCKLRHVRMMLTSRDMFQLMACRFDLDKKHYDETFGNAHSTQFIDKVIASLKLQFEQFKKLDKKCRCLSLWKAIERLNILDTRGESPHFWKMVDKLELEETLEKCPYELASSFEEKLGLEQIIRRGERLEKRYEVSFSDKEPEAPKKPEGIFKLEFKVSS